MIYSFRMEEILFPAERLSQLINQALKKEGIKTSEKKVVVEHPTNENYGDYATNAALVFAPERKLSPRELAKRLVRHLEDKENGFIEEIKIAGPGFINFKLKKEFFVEVARFIQRKDFLAVLKKEGKGRRVVIDYSSPNIAKPFGIGHLRSTNIGQAIYNLYQVLGWQTIGDNHLGDWGTQFGKLIYMIKEKNLEVEKMTIDDLERLYVEFHRLAEKKPSLEEEGRKWFQKLEEGDSEAKKIWQACVDLSLKEFNRIYHLLGVRFDYYLGESFYHFEGWMRRVLADVKRKGLLKKSRGALVVEIPGEKTPAMLVKSDGATTYLLRDLAAIKFRLKKWRPDLVIYEVGADQKLHFRQLFRLSQMLGYLPEEKLVHVAHGFIRWQWGKFSTRRGETIHLEEVIEEGIRRARRLVEGSQTSKGLREEEKKKIARAVAVGGIKFNDLKQEPEKDIIFSWERILSFEGYSAPYLQYTAARCFSVLKKGGKQVVRADFSLEEISPEEEELLHLFYQFPETIKAAAVSFAPHILAQYLFRLGQRFNLFYQKKRIIGSSRQEFRLFLTAVTARILKIGLEILGIEVLEKM